MKIKYTLTGIIILLACFSCSCSHKNDNVSISVDLYESIDESSSFEKKENTKLQGKQAEYGVFIGVDPEQADIFSGYKTIVIDAAYYEKSDITKLHRDGITVYSYLNVGSIEDFRDYFSDYKDLILGEYDNWPGEYWVDVTALEWQNHIQQQAGLLAEKGVDGFFIDNADVYYQFHNPEILQGLTDILNQLGSYNKDIIINGADVFVTEAVLEPDSPKIEITGVNQECVFTNIDFEQAKLVRQSEENKVYYQEYIKQCEEKGLFVFLLEYSEDDTLLPEITEYCDQNNFRFYISKSVGLERE